MASELNVGKVSVTQIVSPSGNVALNPNSGLVTVGGVVQASGSGTNSFTGTLITTGLATFSGGIATNGYSFAAESKVTNVNSLSMAHDTTTTFECPGGLFVIYDTGGYGALFFSDYSMATPTKVAGATHFGVGTGAIQITSATNDSTVTVDNQQGGIRVIGILTMGN